MSKYDKICSENILSYFVTINNDMIVNLKFKNFRSYYDESNFSGPIFIQK